jgi:hypothetical protein
MWVIYRPSLAFLLTFFQSWIAVNRIKFDLDRVNADDSGLAANHRPFSGILPVRCSGYSSELIPVERVGMSHPNNKYLCTAALFAALLPFAVISAPPPGHPGTDEAAQLLGIHREGQEMPYSGQVLQVIDSNNYSYIEVEQDGQSRWLAAPKIALPIGATLRFPDGRVFKSFYSKVHKRTFENILFVDRVMPAE